MQINTNTPISNQKTWLSGFFSVACLSLALFCATASAGDLTSGKLIDLANQSRAKENLPALKENAALKAAAEAKADDMLKNDYFAHTSPKGITPWHWIKQAGYGYKFAGENLAINFTSAKSQHEAWMKSKTHRANILNGNYQEIGIAVAEGKIDGKSATVTVQLFGTPLVPVVAKAAAPEAVPAPVPAPAAVQGTEVAPVAEEAPAEPVMITEVASAPEAMPVPTEPQSLTSLEISWMASILLIQLAFVLAPAAFLWRGIRSLSRLSRTVSAPFQQIFEHQGLHSHMVHSRGGHI